VTAAIFGEHAPLRGKGEKKREENLRCRIKGPEGRGEVFKKKESTPGKIDGGVGAQGGKGGKDLRSSIA